MNGVALSRDSAPRNFSQNCLVTGRNPDAAARHIAVRALVGLLTSFVSLRGCEVSLTQRNAGKAASQPVSRLVQCPVCARSVSLICAGSTVDSLRRCPGIRSEIQRQTT